jgi:capsular polysaccharide biosynthesis protein
MNAEPALEPTIREAEGAIVLPGHSCLYDSEGRRIEASVHWRGGLPVKAGPQRIEPPKDLPTIEGPVVFAGHLPKRHVGHFLLESLSRTWAYLGHGLEGVPFGHLRRDFAPYELQMLRAVLEPSGSSLLSIPRPTRLLHAIIPEQAIRLDEPRGFAHAMVPVYDRIRSMILTDRRPTRSPRPIFLSRSLLPGRFRSTLGERELDLRLERRAVRVLHPQQMPLVEQLHEICSATVVTGLHGSALHLTAFRDLDQASTVSLGTMNAHPNQVKIDELRRSRHVHLHVQFPLQPRLPGSLGGRTLEVGRHRNFLIPRHAEAKLMRALEDLRSPR